jgi:hypothetical protein
MELHISLKPLAITVYKAEGEDRKPSSSNQGKRLMNGLLHSETS